jgi:putative permease
MDIQFERTEDKFIKRERLFKLITAVGVLLLALIVILRVDNMLPSLILASVIYYTLNPMVNALERTGLDRGLAIVIPFVGSGVLAALGIYLLSPLVTQQVESAKADMPHYIEGFKVLVEQANTFANTYVGPVAQISVSDKAVEYLQNWIQHALTDLPGFAGRIFTVVILAPFFAFFMLRDGRAITRKCLELVPNNLFELVLNLFHQVNEQMGGFIRARALESIIVGLVTWMGLALIDFPYSVLLAIVAGITNLIPYIGPIIGAVPAFVVALVNQHNTSTVILLLLVYVIAQVIDMVVIIPLVVAKIVNLHPVTVAIVIIIGSQLMGILGMIISIPVASVIKLTLTAVYNHVIGFRI